VSFFTEVSLNPTFLILKTILAITYRNPIIKNNPLATLINSHIVIYQQHRKGVKPPPFLIQGTDCVFIFPLACFTCGTLVYK